MSRAGLALGQDFMRRRDDNGSARWVGIAIAIVFHIALFAALWQYAPIRDAITDAIPVTVTLIKPPEPEQPKPVQPPVVPPMRPRVTPVPPPIEAPVLTAPADAPSPVIAPAPPPEPPPVEAPAPTVPAVVTVVPPRFDANYLQNPAPVYPALSRRSGEQGKVILHVLVDADGRAKKVELRTSSGFERLDNAALDTVAQWRFLAARQGDRAVEGWVLIPISFALKG